MQIILERPNGEEVEITSELKTFDVSKGISNDEVKTLGKIAHKYYPNSVHISTDMNDGTWELLHTYQTTDGEYFDITSPCKKFY